uniref:Uncharacterized protein n=1 Tax=Klebsiella pneumoniae TaxID=573 RepID=A0A6G9HNI2_KLEPN|nr:hypothetical protein [Klebsiella pneumoniae]
MHMLSGDKLYHLHLLMEMHMNIIQGRILSLTSYLLGLRWYLTMNTLHLTARDVDKRAVNVISSDHLSAASSPNAT